MPPAKAGRAAPIRTCIGCRAAGPATELVRVVLVEGQPVVDARRARPGRGASLHPREACVRAAIQKGAFGRAFRCRVVVTSQGELSKQVAAAYVRSRESNGNPE